MGNTYNTKLGDSITVVNNNIAGTNKNAGDQIAALAVKVAANEDGVTEVKKEVTTINKNVETINRTITAQVKMHWKVVRLVNAITNHMLSILPAQLESTNNNEVVSNR